MSISVRVFQTHDTAGEVDENTYLQQIHPVQAMQAWPDAVMAFIRPFNLSRTGRKGVYAYQGPGRGSGKLSVEGANAYQLDRIDELVQMEEICRVIGMRDPYLQEDIKPYLIPFVVKIRNPYVQVGFGFFPGLVVAVAMLLVPVLAPHIDAFTKMGMPILGIVLGSFSLLMLRRGFTRLKWWRAARAQAKRDGGPIPEELQAWI